MSSIPAAAGIQTGGASGTSGFSEMKSEDFVKIIFTELQNQDPFQPNDSAALLEQLNSIRSIESDMQMTKQLESIVLQNQLAGAGNLIGRYVQGMAEGGLRVDGNVISVVRQGDRIGVELDTGWIIEVEQIELIVDEELLNPSAGGGNNGSGWDVGIPDMNGDGEVDGSDLSLLLGQWTHDDDSNDTGGSNDSGDSGDSGDSDGSGGSNGDGDSP